jgi:hypothetical protein
MGDAPVDGGEWIVTGKTRRWLCAACLERRVKQAFVKAVAENVLKNNDLLRKLKGRDK